MKLLQDKLPNPPREYNQQQFNEIIRKLQAALSKEVESLTDANDREALDYFLSK